MSKINLWNSISLTQTGRIKLLDSGRQLFGTVVQHGVNQKTVTVRVSSRFWNRKYKKSLYSNKSKQVHDEHNYCVTGDRVIIANCNKMSNTKAYYVKTIVKPIPRLVTEKGQKPTEIQQNVQPETIQHNVEKLNKQGKHGKLGVSQLQVKKAQQTKKANKDTQIKQGEQVKNRMSKQKKQTEEKTVKDKKSKDKNQKKQSPAKKSKKADHLV